MPKIADIILMIRPALVTGYKSPYPTVVREITAQYTASKNVGYISGSI